MKINASIIRKQLDEFLKLPLQLERAISIIERHTEIVHSYIRQFNSKEPYKLPCGVIVSGYALEGNGKDATVQRLYHGMWTVQTILGPGMPHTFSMRPDIPIKGGAHCFVYGPCSIQAAKLAQTAMDIWGVDTGGPICITPQDLNPGNALEIIVRAWNW